MHGGARSRSGVQPGAYIIQLMSNLRWTEGSSTRMKRVGYWMTEKKLRRLNFGEFVKICRYAFIDLVKIDLERDLEEQGPFDVLLLKITDQIALCGLGDEKARAEVQRLQNYVNAHPGIVVLDPVGNVQKLLDRHTQYKMATKANTKANRLSIVDDALYFTPAFVELTSLDVETNRTLLHQAGITYPFVCKPSMAHGSSFSHKMSIIFNAAGLADIKPPCVAQTFVNHNAVLYKIFVIGDQYFVVERPSLKNFKAGDQKTIFFDSHDVSKADSSSFLNELDDVDETSEQVAPEPQNIVQLTQAVQAKFKLDLFGIDVIIENTTGKYAVIDINAFPGYDGVPDFFQVLLRLIQRSLHPGQAPPPTPTFRPSATCTECAKVAPLETAQTRNGVFSYRTITHINGYSQGDVGHIPEMKTQSPGHHHHHHHVQLPGSGKDTKIADSTTSPLPNGLSMVGRNHNVFMTDAAINHDVTLSQP